MRQPVEKPLYVPSGPRSRAQRPRHRSVLALMSRLLDALGEEAERERCCDEIYAHRNTLHG